MRETYFNVLKMHQPPQGIRTELILHAVFLRISNCLRSVSINHRIPRTRNGDNTISVLAYLEGEPQISIREMISKTHLLNNAHIKWREVQALTNQMQVLYCQWLVDCIQQVYLD